MLKRTMAIILSLVILCTTLVFSSNAESIYLESEHPYENDLEKMYVYTYPEDVDGFYVTFSKDTSLEPDSWDFEPEDFNPEWTLSDLYEHYKYGDILFVYSGYTEQPCASYEELFDTSFRNYDPDRRVAYDYDDYKIYGDKELSGKTLFIEGNILAIRLVANESVSDYGFAVNYVGTQIPNNEPYVCYNVEGIKYYDFFGESDEVMADSVVDPYHSCKTGFALQGWATQPDGALVYQHNGVIKYEGANIELYPVWTREYYTVSYMLDERFADSTHCTETYYLDGDSPVEISTTGFYAFYWGYNTNLLVGWSEQENAEVAEYAVYGEKLETRDYVLYPVWRKTSFDRSEMFSFEHSYENFTNNYAVNDAHYERMMKSAALTFGINPFSYPLGIASLIFHKTFNESDGWGGSCCGMAITAALQHKGYIDILSEQNVSCVRDLEPTEELISTINYYQAFNIESSLAENQALNVGTPVYRQNIKDFYESAANGNIPMITYFYDGTTLPDVAKNLLTSNMATHVVLAVGAFELDEPFHDDYTRAIIIYNCNNIHGYEIMYVADDWSSMYYDSFDNGILGSFKWTDDYSQFKSFDISGDVEPTAWHSAVIMRIIRFFRIFIESLQFAFNFGDKA